MKITFSRAECEYVAQNPETDLVLTRVGLVLIEARDGNCEQIEIDSSDADYQEFLEVLRDDYIWKVARLPDPARLTSMAQRLLPDFESLTPKKWANKAPEPTPGSVTPRAND